MRNGVCVACFTEGCVRQLEKYGISRPSHFFDAGSARASAESEHRTTNIIWVAASAWGGLQADALSEASFTILR